jgi:hypothetical protein
LGGQCARELLNHVIPLNEFHLRRLGREYLAYYHQDRTHIGLNKNTPAERAIEIRSRLQSRILSTARLGGFNIVTAGRKQREIRAELLLMTHKGQV